CSRRSSARRRNSSCRSVSRKCRNACRSVHNSSRHNHNSRPSSLLPSKEDAPGRQLQPPGDFLTTKDTKEHKGLFTTEVTEAHRGCTSLHFGHRVQWRRRSSLRRNRFTAGQKLKKGSGSGSLWIEIGIR